MVSTPRELVVQMSKLHHLNWCIFSFYFSVLMVLSGCSSWSSRQYACRKTTDDLALMGAANLVAGNFFQVGDCAVSDTLRIETGTYYSVNKGQIDWAVDTDKGRGNGGPSELHDFAKALNCKKESYNDFSEMVFRNKTEIFGEDFNKSGRAVTLKIIELIKSDDKLKNSCR